jgi:hypothetical protein
MDKAIIFEVFTVVAMRNAVFWDVMLCGSCKNRVPPKRRFLQEPHGVIFQKTEFLRAIRICAVTTIFLFLAKSVSLSVATRSLAKVNFVLNITC